MRRSIIAIALVVLAGGAILLISSPGRRGGGPTKFTGHNVLFVTLDTTRADRIGCYGYSKAQTPTIDALAARGTLFEQAISQVPLTLPSHSTMMTGRYPREHGIRDNGRNALSDRHPTLASIFREHGYRTGAFVATFVLDSQYGLDRGFDVYSDEMASLKVSKDPLHAQQPANVVAERALAWLAEAPQKPFFAWVHFYDPHDPYMPPEEYRDPDRDLYDGELTFVDDQLARIFDWLDSQGLTDRTLVVLVGDHGESFDEHGERGHTNFTYETNLHVPLVFAHREVIPAKQRSQAVVELVDLFPTILDLFGWGGPDDLLGSSLAEGFRGGNLPEGDAYSETLYVFNAYGWAEQRSLTTPEWKYISSAQPELYNRKADAGETKNLVLDEPRLASDLLDRLKSRFEAMPIGSAEDAVRDAETEQTLAGLGYVLSGRASSGEEQFLSTDARDPKDMRKALELFRVAKGLMDQAKSKEDFEHILPLLRDLTAACPDALQFQYLYGFCLMNAGRGELAVDPLKAAIQIDPDHSPSLELMADALTQLGDLQGARDHLELAVKKSPHAGRLRVRYGSALEAVGDRAGAIEQFQEALRLSPDLAKAYGKLCSLSNDPAEVRSLAERYEQVAATLTSAPLDGIDEEEEEQQLRVRAEVVFDLGVCYTRAPDLDKAIDSFRTAVKLDPHFGRALLNLGIALLQKEANEEAKSVFLRASKVDGFAAEGHYHLGAVLGHEGRFEDMAEAWEEAVKANPGYAKAIQDLALYYRSRSRFEDMVRILDAGVTASPDDLWMLNGLGQVLATCGNDALRDCRRALTPLERAAHLTSRQNPLVLANLCAAQACIGDFAGAAAICGEALRVAEAAHPSDAALLDRIRTQMALLDQNKAYRDPRL